MSKEKKRFREEMKRLTHERDRNRCVGCSVMIGGVLRDGTTCKDLDAHHITPRHEMPKGGYSLFNLVSLCIICHREAENFLQGMSLNQDFSPETLYKKIGSSEQLALEADGSPRAD
jgi:5-methylcytosine-specific restriction endonuclease McrA